MSLAHAGCLHYTLGSASPQPPGPSPIEGAPRLLDPYAGESATEPGSRKSTLARKDAPTRKDALSVRVHSDAKLTDSEADLLLSDATDVASRSDGADDVACAILLERAGPLVEHTGEGLVETDEQLKAAFLAPGDVKVVETITRCEGYDGWFAGCGLIGGGTFLVARRTGPTEGILWLHEYGHARGLEHRSAKEAVMYGSSVDVSSRSLNAEECSTLTASLPLSTIASRRAAVAHTASDAVVPYAQARALSDEQVTTLVGDLSRPEMEHLWLEAVLKLGMSGRPDAAWALIEFFDSPAHGPLSADHLGARLAVPLALGYSLHVTGSLGVRSWLVERIDPRAWPEAVGGSWWSEGWRRPAELRARLSRLALKGLGLTGRRDVRRKLMERWSDLGQEQAAEVVGFVRGGAPVYVQSLETLDRVSRSGGLTAYYAEPSHPQWRRHAPSGGVAPEPGEPPAPRQPPEPAGGDPPQ